MNNQDNTIQTLLTQAGVNESERQVYQAGLTASSSSAELLAKTNMPRPTLMAALQSLREYNLCKSTKRDGRSYAYTMLPISNLKVRLGKQARDIDELIQRLDNVQQQSDSVDIQTANSQSELESYLELALRCKTRQWQIIAPKDNALLYLPEDYLRYFKKIRKERQIQSQTLWEPVFADQKVSLHDVLMRKPRYIPKTIAKEIPSLMLAFDDTLLIINGTKQPQVVQITNPNITATFRILFEMSWRQSRA